MGPPQLCCQPKNNKPQCSYCKSCGGTWPKEVGRRINKGDWGEFETLGNTCSGSYKKSLDEFSLCCQSAETCKLCNDGCGAGYKEEGRVEAIGDWSHWKVYGSASQCVPKSTLKPTTVTSKAEVTLCCRTQGPQ